MLEVRVHRIRLDDKFIVLTGLRWDVTEPVGEGVAWPGGALHLSDLLDLRGSWSHPGRA